MWGGGGEALTNTVFSKEVSIGTRIMEGLCVFVSIFYEVRCHS